MILAAGLLVLGGLALFVGGLATGSTTAYWGCVACCAVAAVLLVAARLRPAGGGKPAGTEPSATEPAATKPAETEPAETKATATAAAGTAPAASEPTASTTSATEPARTEPAASAPLEPVVAAEPDPAPSTGRHARHAAPEEPAAAPVLGAVTADGGDPGEEDVEVTDLLLVVDLRDEVLVVDEHPRYHLAGCRWLTGRETIPLPVAEARTDGFTPCALCRPDRHLADAARSRRSSAG
ncbi:hypothetical protein [Blastococcus sp. SYSU D00820]